MIITRPYLCSIRYKNAGIYQMSNPRIARLTHTFPLNPTTRYVGLFNVLHAFKGLQFKRPNITESIWKVHNRLSFNKPRKLTQIQQMGSDISKGVFFHTKATSFNKRPKVLLLKQQKHYTRTYIYDVGHISFRSLFNLLFFILSYLLCCIWK